LQPFAWGAVLGLVGISLLSLAIWLGWGSPEPARRTAGAKSSPSPPSGGAETLDLAIGRPPDDDAVWKANPGGESLSPSGGSPSNLTRSKQKSGTSVPVKLAAKMDVLGGETDQAGRSPVGRSGAGRSASSGGATVKEVADDVVVIHRTPTAETGSKAEGQSDSRSDATGGSAPPSVVMANSSTLGGVLSAKAALPALSMPVSQGVTGGQLVRRVPPVYPAQARVLHLEGSVTLAAVIMEDGTVRDVRVIEGDSLLAQSAVDAVQQWRYKPYALDGKPVKNLIRIKVDFKFPASGRSY
jgi:TonB family protein